MAGDNDAPFRSDITPIMRTLAIRHLTEYHYPAPMQFLPHRLFLRPREGHDVLVGKRATRRRRL